MQSLEHHIRHEVLLPLNIHEFYTMDVDALMKEFRERMKGQPFSKESHETLNGLKLEIVQDPQYRRLKSTIDFDVAIKKYNVEQWVDKGTSNK